MRDYYLDFVTAAKAKSKNATGSERAEPTKRAEAPSVPFARSARSSQDENSKDIALNPGENTRTVAPTDCRTCLPLQWRASQHCIL